MAYKSRYFEPFSGTSEVIAPNAITSDKIADETITSDTVGLLEHLQKVNHPVLSMPPLM